MSEQAEAALPGGAAPSAPPADWGRWAERGLWAVVVLGVVARVARYLADRPLWADEATVALMVLDRSLAEQWVARPDDPVTPIGFLVLAKLCSLVFGGSELSLRLVPFLSGMASIPLFYRLGRSLVPRREARLALLLFCISEPLIFYTSEFKQYSSDVLVALAILTPGAQLLAASPPVHRTVVGVALVSAIGIWFSLPAIFVSAGLVAALLAGTRRAEPGAHRSRFVSGLGIAASTGASFLLCYFTTLATHQANAAREGWWATFYPPLEGSASGLAWYLRTFVDFFNDPLGFPAAGVVAGAFVIGAIALARRRDGALVLLAGPVVFAFAAAVLRLSPFPTSSQYGLLDSYYPFFGRVLLFAVPLVMLVVASGFTALFGVSERPTGEGAVAPERSRALIFVASLALAIALATPLYVLVRNTVSPPQIQDMRTLAETMLPFAEPSDRLLTLGYAEPAVDYYMLRSGLPRPSDVLRLRRQADVQPLLETLATIPPGGRFWFVTVHHPHWPTRAEREQLLPVFDRIAFELQSIESFRGHAHLYRRR